MRENLRLSLQIDVSVDVGCVDGDVTEPCADGVDVDTGAQQVCGCRMPDSVRADAPAKQRWMGTAAVRTWFRSIQ